MFDLGLVGSLALLFVGLSAVFVGLFVWPNNKNPNIIDAEWEEVDERKNNRIDVFI